MAFRIGGTPIVFGTFIRDRDGATSIEYALIASLISIAIIGALLFYQEGMGDMYQYIANNISPVFD